MTDEGPVLLYDGTCGFCNSSVQFIIARDRTKTMRFSPLQSEIGQQVIARHPELQNVDSVVYVTAIGHQGREKVSIRSNAALEVCRYLGAPWSWANASRIVPTRLRDAAYDLFARHRYRFFGRHDACMLPPRDVRDRFIGEF